MLFPPTNLTLVSNTLATATLSWGKAPQATSYNVYRDNKPLASGVSALTYTDSTIKSNHRYAYRVSAMVGGVETSYSNLLNVDILQGTTLTFESVYQLQPGEGGYPDVQWRWQ
jgi:hypothetical protein